MAETSGLLELPRELRDDIIERALSTNNLWFDDCIVFTSSQLSTFFKQPALAMVKRQLRTKTLPVFYGKKTFRILHLNRADNKEIKRAERWFTAIKTHLPRIKKIELCLCDDHDTFLQLCAAPGRKTTYRVYETDKVYLFGGAESCTAILGEAEKATKELQDLCDGVGYDGFGPEEYVRAMKLLLFPEDKRCAGHYDLDDDVESEIKYELDEYDPSSSEEDAESDYEDDGDYDDMDLD